MKSLNWETLRNDETESSYYLPHNRENYILRVDTDKPSILTQIIIQETKKAGLTNIFSFGCGIAAQEYQLKKFSESSIVVTDNNSSVLRLKQFNIFDDALILDAFSDSLPVDENWIVLFPRIDTEFDDDQLKRLFEKCHKLKVRQIILIPAELLSLKIVIAEIKTLLLSLVKRKTKLFCGYVRSFDAFKKLWQPYYKLSKKYKGKNAVFILEAK